ncbi:MAG: hypothetical protein ACU85V_20235, partial [Gammaproteobacteria bacterium]
MAGQTSRFRQTALVAALCAAAAGAADEPPGAAASPDAEAALWERVVALAAALPEALGRAGGLETSAALIGADCDALVPEAFENAALRADADGLDDDLGLDLRGGYIYRESGGSGADASQPFDDTLNYDTGGGAGAGGDRHDTFLELSYDLLSSGYRRRRDRSAILRGRAELASMEAEALRLERRQLCRHEYLAASFVEPRARLLDLKRELLSELLPLTRRSYLEGLQFADRYWDVQGELRLARAELEQLSLVWNTPAGGPLNDRYPPLIEMDFDALLAETRDTTDLTRRTLVHKEVLRREHRARNEDRLRLFVRSEQDVKESFDPEFVAGIRFSVPLDVISKTRGPISGLSSCSL